MTGRHEVSDISRLRLLEERTEINHLLNLLINACAAIASATPNPLPGKVSDIDASRIAEACGCRVILEASAVIRESFGHVGPTN